MPDFATGYENEPPEIFAPLPESLAPFFYDVELEQFQEDVLFYRAHIPESGKILELGCGTGRLLRELSNGSRILYGADISVPMLQRAKHRTALPPIAGYICMDMLRPAVSSTFNAIIIAYNTLNLLTDRHRVSDCLNCCRRLLEPAGSLLLQIYVPDDASPQPPQTTFQFQIFDHRSGERLIKEIRKTHSFPTKTISINQRFRLRKQCDGNVLKEDYEHYYDIAAWPLSEWLDLFTMTGFYLEHIQDSYENVSTPAAGSTIRLIKLSVRQDHNSKKDRSS